MKAVFSLLCACAVYAAPSFAATERVFAQFQKDYCRSAQLIKAGKYISDACLKAESASGLIAQKSEINNDCLKQEKAFELAVYDPAYAVINTKCDAKVNAFIAKLKSFMAKASRGAQLSASATSASTRAASTGDAPPEAQR